MKNKKTFLKVGVVCFIGLSTMAYAQTNPYYGRASINTKTPSATFNVKSIDDTKTPKNLELENKDGVKLVTVLNNGNVGINNETPTTPLEVVKTDIAPNGYNRVAGFLTPNMDEGKSTHISLGKSLSRFNAGSIDFVYKGAGSDKNGIGFNLFGSGVNTNTYGPYIIFAQGDGNVGIGTSSPTHKLDIRGNLLVSNETADSKVGINAIDGKFGFVRYSRNNKLRWDAGMLNTEETGDNTGSDYYIRAFNDTGVSISTPFIIQRKTGFIGLGGIYEPSQRLDINGNARVRELPNNTGTATDKIVVVDNTGVLKSVDRSTISSTNTGLRANATDATCSATNAGAIHYKEITIEGKNTGIFGFCMKRGNDYVWAYMAGGANFFGTSDNGATFGAGL